jgi:hypothetical protein
MKHLIAIASLLSAPAYAWEPRTETDKIDGTITHFIKLPSEPEAGQKIATISFYCKPKDGPTVKTTVITQEALKVNYQNSTPIRVKLLDRQPTSYETIGSSYGIFLMGQSVFNAALERDFRLLVEVRTILSGNQTFEFINKDPAPVIEFLEKCKATK